MVSSYPEVRRTFMLARRFAPRAGPVLLMGQTGTGKEYFAKAIHERSGRAGAFLPLNCGGLGALTESELFGYEKGAFTGALAARKGAFEAANGGTLFLDEIGELPLDLQPKMLRVLEVGAIRRVGATAELMVDVRIVAATHRDLHAMVTRGEFREDLYHRLAVFVIHTCPLDGRPLDIQALARQFADAEHVQISDAAMVALEQHRWPGNVRELKNTITRAAALCDDGVLLPEHLEFVGRVVPRAIRVSSRAAVLSCGQRVRHLTRHAVFDRDVLLEGEVVEVDADGAVVVELYGTTGALGVRERWTADTFAPLPSPLPLSARS